MAKQLPPAVFQCSNIGAKPVKAYTWEGAAESDCHANKACSWCKSAAVPAACKDKDMAKKLPAAVFQCDNLDFFKMKDSDCESFSSENTCNANKCSWCKSAAVKAACRDP